MPGGKRFMPRRVSVRKTQVVLDLLVANEAAIDALGDSTLSNEVGFAMDTFQEELVGPYCPNNNNQMIIGAISFARSIAAAGNAGEALPNAELVTAAQELSDSMTRRLTDCGE